MKFTRKINTDWRSIGCSRRQFNTGNIAGRSRWMGFYNDVIVDSYAGWKIWKNSKRSADQKRWKV